MTSKEMAEFLELKSRNTVGNYLRDQSQPLPLVLRIWAQRTNVPVEWLQDGIWPGKAAPPESTAKAKSKSVDQELIGARDAAAILNRSIKSVHRYVANGQLTPTGRCGTGRGFAVILTRAEVVALAKRLNGGIPKASS